jgi:hypothetical protein
MNLYVEKIHAIKFQWFVMVPFGDTKIHHMALQRSLGEICFIISILGHPL